MPDPAFYSLGFLFTQSVDEVYLIRKPTGLFQGKLNGVGKRIIGAAEEINVRASCVESGYEWFGLTLDWTKGAELTYPETKATVGVYFARTVLAVTAKKRESVYKAQIDLILDRRDLAPHISWLLPFCRTRLNAPYYSSEKYILQATLQRC
jgi:hypothetical protein